MTCLQTKHCDERNPASQVGRDSGEAVPPAAWQRSLTGREGGHRSAEALVEATVQASCPTLWGLMPELELPCAPGCHRDVLSSLHTTGHGSIILSVLEPCVAPASGDSRGGQHTLGSPRRTQLGRYFPCKAPILPFPASLSRGALASH